MWYLLLKFVITYMGIIWDMKVNSSFHRWSNKYVEVLLKKSTTIRESFPTHLVHYIAFTHNTTNTTKILDAVNTLLTGGKIRAKMGRVYCLRSLGEILNCYISFHDQYLRRVKYHNMLEDGREQYVIKKRA